MVRAEITIDPSQVAALCREFGVARLSVFGSALREDFDASRSDVDLLVEFFPDRVPGIFGFMELESRLTDLFRREIDLSTPRSLSKYFRDDVLASAEPIYVAA
jgi:predicted nucleotidyltransferase